MINICNRVRTTERRQRGFVLIAALVLAILYFALMELLLIDSSRALAEAQRFRARVVSLTLAENGAELAAQQMIDRSGATVVASNSQGTMNGSLKRTGNRFELSGQGSTTGVLRQDSTVVVQGMITGDQIEIDYTIHSQ